MGDYDHHPNYSVPGSDGHGYGGEDSGQQYPYPNRETILIEMDTHIEKYTAALEDPRE